MWKLVLALQELWAWWGSCSSCTRCLWDSCGDGTEAPWKSPAAPAAAAVVSTEDYASTLSVLQTHFTKNFLPRRCHARSTPSREHPTGVTLAKATALAAWSKHWPLLCWPSLLGLLDNSYGSVFSDTESALGFPGVHRGHAAEFVTQLSGPHDRGDLTCSWLCPCVKNTWIRSWKIIGVT